MNQETVYKVATAAAAALAEGRQPPESWIQVIAWQLQRGNPTEQKAFEAFLRDFGQPRLLRLISRISKEVGETPAFPDPPGEILTLYKPPLPGETQARLAYECFLDGFLVYLQRTYCICALRETFAHAMLFVPEGKSFDLENMWQSYIQRMFSRRGLAESFVLLLNSVQLAGRGIGVLDVPLVSEEQKQLLAGFYLAAAQRITGQFRQRDRQIREAEEELVRTSLTLKERERLEKTYKELIARQKKETEKYQNSFIQAFFKFLADETKLPQRVKKKKNLKAKRAKSSGRSNVPTAPVTFSKGRLRAMRKLLFKVTGNPFQFLEADGATRPEAFGPALRTTDSFTEQARKQLATFKGKPLASLVLEVYRLLDGNVPLTRISPLFSSALLLRTERSAGDASGTWCYSCGRLFDKNDSTYEVRRLLFASPNQRSQSSFSSGPPKACPTCAAIALTCPLKISDQNVIVRLDPKGRIPGVADYLRDYCRMLTVGTLNTAAGRYLSLVCTERTAKGVLASARMGKVVYAVAKLGLELPADVFRDFRLTLIVEGSEISLNPTVLFAAAGFLRGYGQRIIVGGELNTSLGQAVRYMQAGAFYAAEYTFVVNGASFRDDIGLEHHREELWKFLIKQVEEEGMTKNAEQRAKFYGDVAALTGLLYGFCSALRAQVRQDSQKDVGRILGKAIEYVDDSPAFFTYTATTNELPSESARLYKDPSHHFLYDRTTALLAELGLGNRENQGETSSYLQLYFDDITKAYSHFSYSQDYKGEREWKEFLYQVKLSLYSRFPECFASAEDKGK